jgi:hypothetical protein
MESHPRWMEAEREIAQAEEEVTARIYGVIAERIDQHLTRCGLLKSNSYEDGEKSHYFIADTLGDFDAGSSGDALEGVLRVSVDDHQSEDEFKDGIWCGVDCWLRDGTQHHVWIKAGSGEVYNPIHPLIELAQVSTLLHPERLRGQISDYRAHFLLEQGRQGLLPNRPLGTCIPPRRRPNFVRKPQRLRQAAVESWGPRVRKVNREGRTWVSQHLMDLRGGPSLEE